MPALRSSSWLWHDKRDFSFRASRRAELDYARRLRRVADRVAELVRSTDNLAELETLLRRYADTIEPWARSVARRMIADVDKRNERTWVELSREMSRSLREEIRRAPTGHAYATLMQQQVELIKSLPIEAAQKVHELAAESLLTGARPDEIAGRIEGVTLSRANTIARTEVGRASTTLVQVRAQAVGSTEYVWRTARDSNVRLSHRAMEGKVVRWDSPPTIDNMTGHAGALVNCRCFPQVLFPEKY